MSLAVPADAGSQKNISASPFSYQIVRLHDVLDDDHSQHKPGVFGGGTTVAFEVLVIKPANSSQGTILERTTHRLFSSSFASKGILKSEIESCLELLYRIIKCKVYEVKILNFLQLCKFYID